MALFDAADLHAQIHAAVVAVEKSEITDSINACLHCAEGIMTASKQSPDAALAYFTCTLAATPPDLSPTILRSLTLLCLTGRRDHINEHSLQHMLAATLLAYALQMTPAVSASAMRKHLLQRGLSLWPGIVRLSKSLFHPGCYTLLQRAALKASERRVISACHMALATPRRTPAERLREYIRRSPAFYQPLYESWLLIPAGILNGHQVVTADQRRGTALCVLPDFIAVALNDGDITVCEWLPVTQVAHQQGRAVSFDQWNVLFARHADELSVQSEHSLYPASYPVHRPPASLTRIIDALQQPDSDIDVLVRMIEKEPSFSSFLLASASVDNRMQLPVSSIKQAILTFGLERIGDMLVQHALSQRLTQHRFPLDRLCHQFATLTAGIASQLASRVNSRFTPQAAALTATFLVAPLFTLPELKVLQRLPLSDKGYFDPNKLLRIETDSAWQSLAGELAGGWHQSASWRALLHHAGKVPVRVPSSLRREHCILQIAQILARQWLFGENLPCEQTRNVLLTAQQILDVSAADVAAIQQQLSSLLVCPHSY